MAVVTPFSSPSFFIQNQIQFERYINHVYALPAPENETEKLRRSVTTEFLRELISSSKNIEQDAPLVMRRDSSNLLTLTQLTSKNQDTIQSFSRLLFRLAYERMLRGKVLVTQEQLLRFFSFATPDLLSEDRYEITIEAPRLMNWIVSDMLETHSSNVNQADKVIEERISAHTKKIEEWKLSIASADENLLRQREYIDNLKYDFNFVGLSKAFKDMEDQTEGARRSHFRSMCLLGIAIILPLLSSAGLLLSSLYFHKPNTQAIELTHYFMAAGSILSIELILIYFFRVVLKNYQSLRALTLQLRHRRALCAFIQSYMDFKKQNKDNAIDKFEALIFSGLAADPDKLPSTFDGMEHVLQVAKAFRDPA